MLVQASGLLKQYPRIRALDQVSLEIKEGEVFALFGRNGAGKTTCLRVLSGLTQPDQGSTTLVGDDVRAAPDAVRCKLRILNDIPLLSPAVADAPPPYFFRYVAVGCL